MLDTITVSFFCWFLAFYVLREGVCMNKNRNKVAAMMMVAAITVSSVAMPVEAAVNSVKNSNIRKEEKINSGIDNVVLDSPYFEDDNFINKITEITGIQPGNPIGNNLSAIQN